MRSYYFTQLSVKMLYYISEKQLAISSLCVHNGMSYGLLCYRLIVSSSSLYILTKLRSLSQLNYLHVNTGQYP